MVEGKFEYAAQKLFMKCKIIQFDAKYGFRWQQKMFKTFFRFYNKTNFYVMMGELWRYKNETLHAFLHGAEQQRRNCYRCCCCRNKVLYDQI